ncbi:hypothetical protein K432DRAFT_404059 [Lepidopterella palustris CBS 459.81]|uniref:FHA domain-containing protein n=1 Tax=Lepidopterella palustris CBS 459.81 TaxID=1314670 RepID=A0A8E2EC78_9PEZI|nr:hypothetical protein K432DRAFT_404059 [Lepidopterella palustris CBS 459.81]
MPQAVSDSLEVTLRSVDGLDEYKERKIILAPNSKVPVGRASKSNTKNLRAAPSNAYIDSPVVSRDHAVISAKLACGTPTVYIRDCGSMHGTILNEDRLDKGRDLPLKNGDVLQFGFDVHRDNDTFIAQKFRFECKPVLIPTREEASAPKTFAVPQSDTSDEEESEEESSVIDGSEHESISSVADKRPSPIRAPREIQHPATDHLGSQSNPVNISDDTDKIVVIEVDDDEEPVASAVIPPRPSMAAVTTNAEATPLVQSGVTKHPVTPPETKEEEVLRITIPPSPEGGEDGESANRVSLSPRSYRFQSYLDNLEDDSDCGDGHSVSSDISHQEMSCSIHAHADSESESSAINDEIEYGEIESNAGSDDNSEHSMNNLPGVEFEADGFASDDSDDSASGEEDEESDAACRLKMIDMLNNARQRQEGGSSVLCTNQRSVSDVLPPSSMERVEHAMKSPTKTAVLHPIPSTVPQNVETVRSSGIPMSFMLNEKDQMPSTPSSSMKDSSDKVHEDNTSNRPNHTESWFAKRAATPKNSEVKQADVGTLEFFNDFFEPSSWNANTVPVQPRPVAPKQMPWQLSIRENPSVDFTPFPFARDEAWSGSAWNEGLSASQSRFHAYSSLPYSDGGIANSPYRPIADNSRTFTRYPNDRNYPSSPAKPLDSFVSSSAPQNSYSTFARKPVVAMSTPVIEQPMPQLAAPSTSKDANSSIPLPDRHITSAPAGPVAPEGQKTKTGMSIPEIVEDTTVQSTKPSTNLKRKADAVELEQEESAVDEVPSTKSDEASSDVRSNVLQSRVPDHRAAAPEKPRKRTRLSQFAATAVAGVVVGAVGAVGALIYLPETVFQ